MLPLILLLLWSSAFPACSPSPIKVPSGAEGEYARQREAMVESQLQRRDITDRRVLEAMREVPRHRFMSAEVRRYAYADHPVPIGGGQTISQPYIVALMTQLSEPRPGDRALEIGTGSGYQAAVLSKLVQEVYTIEIVPSLAEQARQTLDQLGYENVTVRQGDGYRGWPERAPFDVILVTAAPERIPEPLLEQLAEGGRLVIPVGPEGAVQRLMLVTKREGKIQRVSVTDVRFVPMTGEVQGR